MRTVSIGSMIKSLSGMLGTRDLNQWETDFIQNAIDRSNNGVDTSKLSDKQVEIIDRIYRENFA